MPNERRPILFVSYRRADAPDSVKLLCDGLVRALPNWEVFYDQRTIAPGDAFPELIRQKVAAADVVLVVIGPRWVQLLHDRAKSPRLDHVREEVRLGLESDARVIPLSVGMARVPRAEDLAEFPDIKSLAELNASRIRPEPDFDHDLADLIAYLERIGPGVGIGAVLDGKYKIVRELGAGGMGIVYAAEQQHPRRTVAIKLVKPGMDSREILARFDAERQALAVMDHPNIARVLDAGTTPAGRPYFAMELVSGIPITNYCDEQRLPPNERLQLFTQVCEAVQHAHQKGVIHRDIKPSNVLVEVRNGKPVPKVIDFGLAKALGYKLTDKTLHTSIDARIGTLEYSSPEQAAGRVAEIDTRTDVYSLGAMLYELLVGQPPFSREQLLAIGEDEMRRVIRESDPPRPSAKLSSSHNLGVIASNRQLSAPKLLRLVRGELDWIVAKALEKMPSHRYQSATGLAEDVASYLAGRPITAHRSSTVYRAIKWIKRRPALAAVVLAIAFGTAMGINASIQSAINFGLKKARDDAVAARQDAERASYFSRTSVAGYAWQKSQLSSMIALLNQTAADKDLHGFEWHYLQRMRQYPELVLRGDGYITRAAYSPDGQHIVTNSNVGHVSIWDVSSGTHKQLENQVTIFALAVSTTGLIAVQGANNSIHLYELASANQIGELAGHQGTVSDLEFDATGKWLVASVGADPKPRQVFVWDVDARAVKASFPINIYRGVALSSGARRLAAGDRSGNVHLFDLQSNGEIALLKQHRGNITDLEFSLDDRFLGSSSLDGSVCWWDIEQAKLVWQTNFREMIFGLTVTPDGKTVIAVGANGIAFVLSAESGTVMYELRAHTGPMETIDIHPDGGKFVTGGEDGLAVVLPLSESQSSQVLRGHTKTVWQLAVSRDGRWGASVSEDETIRIWDMATGECAQSFKANGMGVKAVAFNPAGDRWASGGWDSLVSIWDWKNGQRVAISPQFPGDVTSVSYSPDGSRIVCAWAGDDNKVRIVDSGTGAILEEFRQHSHWVHDAEFSPDGSQVASIDQHQICFVWDAATGDIIYKLNETGGERGSVAFHPSGQWLTTTTMELGIQEWNLADGSRGRLFPGHSSRISALGFTEDGSRMISASRDRSIRLWDFSTGQLAIELIGHSSQVTSAAIDLTGDRILSGDNAGIVRLWDGSPAQELATTVETETIGDKANSPPSHLPSDRLK